MEKLVSGLEALSSHSAFSLVITDYFNARLEQPNSSRITASLDTLVHFVCWVVDPNLTPTFLGDAGGLVIDISVTNVTRKRVRFQAENCSLLKDASVRAHIPMAVGLTLQVALARTIKRHTPSWRQTLRNAPTKFTLYPTRWMARRMCSIRLKLFSLQYSLFVLSGA